MTDTIPFPNRADLEGPVEETSAFAPVFDHNGLIPAVVTDSHDGHLLMVAYMNRESLSRTIRTGQAWYWSRSRRALWRKGATSGHTQKVVTIRTDCDQDTVQLVVEQTGPACHTGRRSCFYREIVPKEDGTGTLLRQA